MNKKYIILSLIVVLIFLLSGCFIGSKLTLPDPIVTLSEDGSYISWEEIPNAVYYEVNFNGTKISVRDETVYYFTSGGEDMTVTVQAIGDGLVYVSSAIVTITGDFSVMLDTPILTFNRVVDDLVIGWALIPNVSGYLLTINEVDLPEIASSIITYSYPMPAYGTYNVKLTALAPLGSFYVEASAEEEYIYVMPVPASMHQGEVTSKDYDKADSNNIEFLIDFNDDTTSGLSGEGITNSDYSYLSNVLSIDYSYLRTLSNATHNFTFTTEQFNQILTIEISDSRSPQLITSGTNFNKGTLGNADLEIELVLNSATLNSVLINDVLLTLNSDYLFESPKIIFDSTDLYSMDIGIYIVEIVLDYDSSVLSLYYTINIINTALPYSYDTSITFDKGSPANINFGLFMNTYNFDTLQGLLTEDDWNYNSSSDVLTIYDDYLMTLDNGNYNFVVYTDINAFAITLEVINNSNNCYNVAIDLDSDYPNMLLTWDYDGTSVDYYYRINSGSSVHIIGAKQAVITSVTKSSTFTYEVKAGSGAYSPIATWTPDAAGTSYMNTHYDFMGDSYDYYINSQEELNNFIYYACFDRTDAIIGGNLPGTSTPNTYGYIEMPEVFIAFDYGTTITSGDSVNELNIALNSIPLKGSYSISCSIYPDGRTTFTAIFRSVEEPDLNLNSENVAVQQDFYPSDIEDLKGPTERIPAYNSFAINSITKTQSVKSSEQLFNTVNIGVKPIPVVGSDAERIYNLAKDVLRDIITDDMTDFEKIHAIYDWLIYNVQYDKAVLEIYINPLDPNYDNLNRYDCFYLEGVFDDGVAVCDGFAKAFVLLNRIEGIEAIKVSGVSHSQNHAWNKVNLGGNWYTVDSTWGNITSTSGTEEHMTHAYLLVSDAELFDSHRESDPTVSSPVSYDFFKQDKYDGVNDYYIESIAEFQALITYLAHPGNTIYVEIYNDSISTNQQLLNSVTIVGSFSRYDIGNVLLLEIICA